MRNTLGTLLLAGVLTLFGCADTETPEMPEADTTATGMGEMMEEEPAVAVAQLQPTEGNSVQGSVTFTEEMGGVRVVANIMGLTEGEHGFHIHENGDCSAPDASSAGGHFNPDGSPHGAPMDTTHHVGDMGNLQADASGTARLDETFEFLTLEGMNGIVGKAVIVHEDPDDLESQPSGNAGARLACGVIQMQGAGMGMPMDTTTMPADTAGALR